MSDTNEPKHNPETEQWEWHGDRLMMTYPTREAAMADLEQAKAVATATEKLCYSTFCYSVHKPSSLIPGLSIQSHVNMYCPRCKLTHEGGIEHGQTKVCECGLTMTVHGNSLEISGTPIE